MGASQLTRLKARSNATPAKKKSSTTSFSTRPNVKNKNIPNPFAVQLAHKKFPVLSRKSIKQGEAYKTTTVSGRPEQSRLRGQELRRQQLLPQIRASRDGRLTEEQALVDRRWGENDPTLSLEEKAEKRSGLERKMLLSAPGKKRRFDLEEESGELTHYGRSLDEWDRGGLTLDDEQDHGWGGKLGSGEWDRVKKFKGEDDDDDEGRKKTKSEIMSEIIQKSKFYKNERRKQKDADEELRLDLDREFQQIRGLIGFKGRESGDNSLEHPKVAERPGNDSADEETVSSEDEKSEQEEFIDDESQFEELDFGANLEDDLKQSNPINIRTVVIPNPISPRSTDVTLTFVRATTPDIDGPSKVDQRLLASLLARSRSPSAEAEDSDVDLKKIEHRIDSKEPQGEQDYDRYVRILAALPRSARAGDRTKTEEEKLRDRREELIRREEERRRRMIGDNVDDEEEELDLEGSDVGEEEQERRLKERLAQLEDEDEGEEEDDDEMANLFDEDEDEVEVKGKIQSLVSSLKRPIENLVVSQAEPSSLPFTFPCPTAHSQFLRILANAGVTECDAERLGTIVDRIKTLYHPRFGEGNKAKLELFQAVLIDHYIYLALTNSGSSLASVLKTLTVHILTLSALFPLSTSAVIISKLKMMQSNLLIGLTTSPHFWPGKAELLLFRLIGILFSTSDYHHSVVSPTMLLIGQYLGQCRIAEIGHITTGLFLCSIVLQYEEEHSKRFMPEVINFLANVLGLLMVPRDEKRPKLPPSVPFLDWNSNLREMLSLTSAEEKLDPHKISFNEIGASVCSNVGQLKVNLGMTCLALIGRCAKMCSFLPGFIEMFTPFQILLDTIEHSSVCSSLDKSRNTLQNDLKRMLNVSSMSRRPLELQDHAPVGIPTFLPKFDDDYAPSSYTFDPNSERVEAQKLRAQYRKERKGAIRELRKDNKFLAAEEARRRKEEDERYQKKVNKIMGGLEMERKEEKDLERIKERERKKDKKRAGGSKRR